MPFVIQHVQRNTMANGTTPAIYIVNDGHNTALIPSDYMGNRDNLYLYVGNGDRVKGISLVNSPACLVMPSLKVYPKVYNEMIATMHNERSCSFKG